MKVNSEFRLAHRGDTTRYTFEREGLARWLRGVYGPRFPSEPVGFERRRLELWARVRATMALYGDRGVVPCGPTALQLLGVALPTSVEDWDQCHVFVPPGVTRPQRAGVVAHRYPTAVPVWRIVNGVPVPHPVDAWVRLRGAAIDDLVAVGDGLVRRRSPLLSLTQIDARLGALAGSSGVNQARRARLLMCAGTESLPETRTRLTLVRAGLPQPDVNLAVWCPTVGVEYHLDMGYKAERFGIEYDGAGHVGDRHQMEIDAERRRHIQDAGWMIIPVTAAQLANPRGFICSVESALVTRRAQVASQVSQAGW